HRWYAPWPAYSTDHRVKAGDAVATYVASVMSRPPAAPEIGVTPRAPTPITDPITISTKETLTLTCRATGRRVVLVIAIDVPSVSGVPGSRYLCQNGPFPRGNGPSPRERAVPRARPLRYRGSERGEHR